MPAKKTPKSKAQKKSEPIGPPKVFDVAKPGETAADATARPVIVGHGTMIKNDPMVVDDETPKEEKPVSNRGVSIKPIGDQDAENTEVVADKAEEPPAEGEQESTKTVDTAKTDSQPEGQVVSQDDSDASKDGTQEAPEESEKVDQKDSETEGEGVTNALTSELVAKKEAEEKSKEIAKRSKQTEELVESKKYFVNIHQGPTSGGVGKWLFLILIIALVAGLALIDAGLIDVGITLPFDILEG